MTTTDLWALLAAGIATIVGFLIALHVTEWRERRRKAARYAAAEAEFWAALVRYVDRARADIDVERDIALWEAEVSG